MKERWDTNVATIREPQYVAIHITGTDCVRVIMEIDYKESKLEEGIIVPLGEPISVCIPIRSGNDKLLGIRYTTFRKLITHETTDNL